ncbi:unnamed protein product [marine sediment metagenome]|uniref:Uncharacterized protein n=1 Tax=marine sediment metagenome TaxID=412755 RepID=X0RL17_9ZZZZ
MANDRYLHRKIAHVISHLEKGSYGIALGLLRKVVEDDNERVREGDRDGKCTDGES